MNVKIVFNNEVENDLESNCLIAQLMQVITLIGLRGLENSKNNGEI